MQVSRNIGVRLPLTLLHSTFKCFQSDLNCLDQTTREISRHLEELGPKRMRENSLGHSLRGGEGLGGLVSHDKPSIMEKRAPRTAEQPMVGRLSDAKRAVLMGGEEGEVMARGGKDPVGRLSQEQMAVLMAQKQVRKVSGESVACVLYILVDVA